MVARTTASTDRSFLQPAPPLPGAMAACRAGDPLANVYSPDRLEVVSSCSTVGGTVMFTEPEVDGDVHVDLAVDPPYRSMLDAVNLSNQHGWLVTEIVPADQPRCVKGYSPRLAEGRDYGRCTGADLPVPRPRQHVWVTGPFVVDHAHGWTEIHPVWAITTTTPFG